MNLVRILFVFFVLADGSLAYTAKKREQRRPAFSASQSTAASKDTDKTTTTTTAGGNTAAFALPPKTAIYVYHQPADEDEELVIGYGTALASCLFSLALGFGLGYGT